MVVPPDVAGPPARIVEVQPRLTLCHLTRFPSRSTYLERSCLQRTVTVTGASIRGSGALEQSRCGSISSLPTTWATYGVDGTASNLNR